MWNEMEEHHKRTLTKHRVYIIQNVDYADIGDHLIASDTIQLDDHERIHCEKTRNDKMGMLMDMLPKKGPNAFNNFKSSLAESEPNYGHIVERLMNTAEQEYKAQSIYQQDVGPAEGATSQLPVEEDTDTIDERDLNDMADDIGDEWQSLGIELGIKMKKLQHFRYNNQKLKGVICEMLCHWNDNSNQTRQAKIEQLRNALEKCGLYNIVHQHKLFMSALEQPTYSYRSDLLSQQAENHPGLTGSSVHPLAEEIQQIQLIEAADSQSRQAHQTPPKLLLPPESSQSSSQPRPLHQNHSEPGFVDVLLQTEEFPQTAAARKASRSASEQSETSQFFMPASKQPTHSYSSDYLPQQAENQLGLTGSNVQPLTAEIQQIDEVDSQPRQANQFDRTPQKLFLLPESSHPLHLQYDQMHLSQGVTGVKTQSQVPDKTQPSSSFLPSFQLSQNQSELGSELGLVDVILKREESPHTVAAEDAGTSPWAQVGTNQEDPGIPQPSRTSLHEDQDFTENLGPLPGDPRDDDSSYDQGSAIDSSQGPSEEDQDWSWHHEPSHDNIPTTIATGKHHMAGRSEYMCMDQAALLVIIQEVSSPVGGVKKRKAI